MPEKKPPNLSALEQTDSAFTYKGVTFTVNDTGDPGPMLAASVTPTKDAIKDCLLYYITDPNLEDVNLSTGALMSLFARLQKALGVDNDFLDDDADSLVEKAIQRATSFSPKRPKSGDSAVPPK